MPPRIAVPANSSVVVTASPSSTAPAMAASSGTLSCTLAAWIAATGQGGVPDGIADPGRQRAGKQRVGHARPIPRLLAQRKQAEHRRQWNRPEKITRSGCKRCGCTSSTERIDAPGDAGQDHQQSAIQGRGAAPREQQDHQSTDRQQQAGELPGAETLASQQAPGKHAQLYGTEQQQCAGAGVQVDIGKGKAGRVDEQRHGTDPVTP